MHFVDPSDWISQKPAQPLVKKNELLTLGLMSLGSARVVPSAVAYTSLLTVGHPSDLGDLE